jgi:N-acetylneuraminic acid mutarotase
MLAHPEARQRPVSSTRHRVGRAIATCLTTVLALACSDSAGPPSDRAPEDSVRFVAALSTASEQEAAWVSLSPGALPQGRTARIHVRSSGLMLRVAMIDGGFDPVPLPAVEGDSIEITVALGTDTTIYAVRVAPRPPRVVRTNPPKNKRDVPLNSIVVVVFSEPVNPLTVTPTTLQLRKDGAVVDGRLAFPDPSSTIIEFHPSAPLAPGGEYEIVVEDDISDPTGFALDSGVVAPFVTVADTSAPSAAWTAHAPIPTPRHCHGFEAVNGVLYAIAGRYAVGNEMTTVEAYDPATDQWTAKASLPVRTGLVGTGVIGGILYVVGGDGGSRNKLWAYDPATDQWTEKAPMSTGRWDLAATVLDGKLYAIAGGQTMTPFSTLASVDVYDPASDSWSPRAPLPEPRQGARAVAAGGRIYLFGGYARLDTASYDASMSIGVGVYDPATDRWSTAAAMPQARVYPTAAIVGGSIYVAGGSTWSAIAGSGMIHVSVDVFDPTQGTWTTGPALPAPRSCAGVATVGGTIYIAGGRDTNESLISLTP